MCLTEVWRVAVGCLCDDLWQDRRLEGLEGGLRGVKEALLSAVRPNPTPTHPHALVPSLNPLCLLWNGES